MEIAPVTRRTFLATAAAASAFPCAPVRAASRYKRCLVTTPAGKKALASYAKGVAAMLKLPPDNPQNWFRNAFIHLMDCPHGNWWFYDWHRGYLGYFEETIRSLSGDPDFALPYWDWTQLPAIPDTMFDGPLTPTSDLFKPYTETLDIFTTYFKPSFTTFWNARSAAQKKQLDLRGYPALDALWNDVTGNGVPANESFAVTSGARYLSPSNPHLDADTTVAVSANTVRAGLRATTFNDASGTTSFTSSKTASHNTAPSQTTIFSILEGQPHNLVHNCIGGVGPIPNGPFGNMTNFLSPVDPIFFLHHANMDRLWDVWTRKQKAAHRPYLPPAGELKTFAAEPFLFYVDGKGQFVANGRAGDYLSMARFGYDYDDKGFGEELVGTSATVASLERAAPAHLAGNAATAPLPKAAAAQSLVAQVTVERPDASSTRQFRVFLGAPADATDLGTDSPYYVGTVGFFGAPMGGMKMAHEATFALPLPEKLAGLETPASTDMAPRETRGAKKAAVAVQVVPMNGSAGGEAKATPVLKAFSIEAL